MNFFDGLNIMPNGIHIVMGATGMMEAFGVQGLTG
jgi:hypothetical protein